MQLDWTVSIQSFNGHSYFTEFKKSFWNYWAMGHGSVRLDSCGSMIRPRHYFERLWIREEKEASKCHIVLKLNTSDERPRLVSCTRACFSTLLAEAKTFPNGNDAAVFVTSYHNEFRRIHFIIQMICSRHVVTHLIHSFIQLFT